MLNGQKKHIDKEQGKTKHETPRSVNYRVTKNKNNIGTTALERSVVYTTFFLIYKYRFAGVKITRRCPADAVYGRLAS